MTSTTQAWGSAMPGGRNESSTQPEPFAGVDAGRGAVLGGVRSQMYLLAWVTMAELVLGRYLAIFNLGFNSFGFDLNGSCMWN